MDNIQDPWRGLTLEQRKRIHWHRPRMPRRVYASTPVKDAVGCAVFLALVWAMFCLVGVLV